MRAALRPQIEDILSEKPIFGRYVIARVDAPFRELRVFTDHLRSQERNRGDAQTDENGSLSLADFGDSNEITLRAGKKRAGVVELED